jgi:hypothetical protein
VYHQFSASDWRAEDFGVTIGINLRDDLLSLELLQNIAGHDEEVGLIDVHPIEVEGLCAVLMKVKVSHERVTAPPPG